MPLFVECAQCAPSNEQGCEFDCLAFQSFIPQLFCSLIGIRCSYIPVGLLSKAKFACRTLGNDAPEIRSQAPLLRHNMGKVREWWLWLPVVRLVALLAHCVPDTNLGVCFLPISAQAPIHRQRRTGVQGVGCVGQNGSKMIFLQQFHQRCGIGLVKGLGRAAPRVPGKKLKCISPNFKGCLPHGQKTI